MNTKINGVPQTAYLIIDSQVFQILSPTTSIGRKLENKVVIQDEKISRNHAEIRYEFGQFYIYDLNSTGGTFVNNKEIDKCAIYSGDVISLADIKIMFINDQPKIRKKAQDKTRGLAEKQ